MKRNTFGTGLAAVIGLAVLALPVACGEAKAQPLEVTYYYLPG